MLRCRVAKLRISYFALLQGWSMADVLAAQEVQAIEQVALKLQLGEQIVATLAARPQAVQRLERRMRDCLVQKGQQKRVRTGRAYVVRRARLDAQAGHNLVRRGRGFRGPGHP